MMKRLVTLKDIAEKTGFSKTAVSMALRDDERINVETRAYIKQTAAEMGYQRNAVVDHLMTELRNQRIIGHRGVLGLINPDPDETTLERYHAFREWTRGCTDQARTLGYELETIWLHQPALSPDKLAAHLEERRICGIVIPATCGVRTLIPSHRFLWEQQPNVVIGVQTRDPELDASFSDQHNAVRRAFFQLEQAQYQRIGLAITQQVEALVQDRFSAGFLSVHSSDNAMIISYDEHASSAKEDVMNWIKNNQLDGVICIDQRIMGWIQEAGFDVPNEIGLANLDWDESLTDWAGINQQHYRVGQAAMNLLVSSLQQGHKGPPVVPQSVITACEWMAGPSVRSVPSNAGNESLDLADVAG